jgi:hypothetical protein
MKLGAVFLAFDLNEMLDIDALGRGRGGVGGRGDGDRFRLRRLTNNGATVSR